MGQDLQVKDGVLKRSCRNYRYGYAITPPKGDWALETFLVGPGRRAPLLRRHGHRHGPARRATTSSGSAGPSTRPGVFKIRALLSVQDESGKNYVRGWLPVTRFRLR